MSSLLVGVPYDHLLELLAKYLPVPHLPEAVIVAAAASVMPVSFPPDVLRDLERRFAVAEIIDTPEGGTLRTTLMGRLHSANNQPSETTAHETWWFGKWHFMGELHRGDDLPAWVDARCKRYYTYGRMYRPSGKPVYELED